MRHGGQLLVECLRAHDVQRVFSVPGESFLAVLDGLYDSAIENIVCRHEGGAAMMAVAMAKMTGRPGVAFVTRGPGATNAAAGVHIARQDSEPMTLFVGQVARGHRDREAFQEVDYRAMFGSLAKWVAEIDDAERIPEYINRAFHVAMSGRPGPVVLSLPEDMLSGKASAEAFAPTAPATAAVSRTGIDTIQAEIGASTAPLIVAGGPFWTRAGADALRSYAERNNLPVAVSFRRSDILDNRWPNYVGDLSVGMNPKLAQRLKAADCLLVLGARISDIMTDGYTMLEPKLPQTRLLHVHPDPDLPGTVFRTDLSIAADPVEVVGSLAQEDRVGDWSMWTQAARADFDAWRRPTPTPGAVKLEEVVLWLSDTLPDDAIITNGAGNYAAFVHRYFAYKQLGTQLAPTSGSMGFGYPAAVSASIQYPARTVVCFAGDGCFQMTLNEMATAAQYGAKPIVIVANNGRYGTIRMHQEKTYPGRVSGTDMRNPDFAALARAYGGHGETVSNTADFPDAFRRAEASGTVAVIELQLDPEMLSTGQTVSEARGRHRP